jgi:hypothetical protein
VDDIMLLGETPQQVISRASATIDLMTSLGVRVNRSKSMQSPSQVVHYLGHVINFRDNKLHPAPQKLPQTLRVLKDAGKGAKIVPRHLAAVGGHLLDCVKSNVSLHGLPQQVMKEAGRSVHWNSQKLGTWERAKNWNTPVEKSHRLKRLLLDCQHAILNPTPRPFRPTKNDVYTLRTDASEGRWGASLTHQGK